MGTGLTGIVARGSKALFPKFRRGKDLYLHDHLKEQQRNLSGIGLYISRLGSPSYSDIRVAESECEISMIGSKWRGHAIDAAETLCVMH